jgi:hypothetical protein
VSAFRSSCMEKDGAGTLHAGTYHVRRCTWPCWSDLHPAGRPFPICLASFSRPPILARSPTQRNSNLVWKQTEKEKRASYVYDNTTRASRTTYTVDVSRTDLGQCNVMGYTSCTGPVSRPACRKGISTGCEGGWVVSEQ